MTQRCRTSCRRMIIVRAEWVVYREKYIHRIWEPAIKSASSCASSNNIISHQLLIVPNHPNVRFEMTHDNQNVLKIDHEIIHTFSEIWNCVSSTCVSKWLAFLVINIKMMWRWPNEYLSLYRMWRCTFIVVWINNISTRLTTWQCILPSSSVCSLWGNEVVSHWWLPFFSRGWDRRRSCMWHRVQWERWRPRRALYVWLVICENEIHYGHLMSTLTCQDQPHNEPQYFHLCSCSPSGWGSSIDLWPHQRVSLRLETASPILVRGNNHMERWVRIWGVRRCSPKPLCLLVSTDRSSSSDRTPGRCIWDCSS